MTLRVLTKRSSHLLAAVLVSLFFGVVPGVSNAAVWGELDVGSCFQDPWVPSGESFSVECTDGDSGGNGTGAIRGEIGSLGARLSSPLPSLPGSGVPAVFADARKRGRGKGDATVLCKIVASPFLFSWSATADGWERRFLASTSYRLLTATDHGLVWAGIGRVLPAVMCAA
jgi:hypothetical protein